MNHYARPVFQFNNGAGSQKGFGLIEVLIAVLVLAIGLLGMASLQTTGIQMTTGALSRTQAVFLVEDLIERARANSANLATYEVAAGAPPACNSTYAVANSSVSAEDLAEWRNNVSCLLPGGDAAVSISAVGVMTVQVTWLARSGQTSDGSIRVEADI
jgi:type IV pilus assembly protein PilV